MCRRVALRSLLRIALVLLIGVALLPVPCVSIMVSALGQGQGRGPRTAPPRPGKPEGMFPDLDEVKHESSIEREPKSWLITPSCGPATTKGVSPRRSISTPAFQPSPPTSQKIRRTLRQANWREFGVMLRRR